MRTGNAQVGRMGSAARMERACAPRVTQNSRYALSCHKGRRKDVSNSHRGTPPRHADGFSTDTLRTTARARATKRTVRACVSRTINDTPGVRFRKYERPNLSDLDADG